MCAALSRARRVKSEDLLVDLYKSTIQELCDALGIDRRGTRTVLAERLLSTEKANGPSGKSPADGGRTGPRSTAKSVAPDVVSDATPRRPAVGKAAAMPMPPKHPWRSPNGGVMTGNALEQIEKVESSPLGGRRPAPGQLQSDLERVRDAGARRHLPAPRLQPLLRREGRHRGRPGRRQDAQTLADQGGFRQAPGHDAAQTSPVR